MKNICFLFQLHMPVYLKRYRFFQIGQDHYYYDDFLTEEKIRIAAEQSYLPVNKTIAEMIRSSNGKFKCAISISGVAMELLEQYAPEVMDSFKNLVQTGCVEIVAEPYSNSLSSIYDLDEFTREVKLHSEKVLAVFGVTPVTLKNSELIYSDEIGEWALQMGYSTILIEEAKHIMGWKSPNFVYHHATSKDLKLFVRNLKLSEDIAVRFSNRNWNEFPLTAEKLAQWISASPAGENIFNLWFGYETLGMFQKQTSGIFEFLKAFPYYAMEHQLHFTLPQQLSNSSDTSGPLKIPYPTSWCGHEKDVSLWNGNDLQQEALHKLYSIGERVRMSKDNPLKHQWLMLQSLDHFRYMSHKDTFGTHYESPYDAFTNYMNVLSDFIERVNAQFPDDIDNEELNELLTTINEQEEIISKLQKEIKKLKADKKNDTE